MGWVLLLVIAALWVSSLWLHPLMACKTCKGTSRHWGSVHKTKFRFCHVCGGSGRKVRPGARALVALGMLKNPVRAGSLGWNRRNRREGR